MHPNHFPNSYILVGTDQLIQDCLPNLLTLLQSKDWVPEKKKRKGVGEDLLFLNFNKLTRGYFLCFPHLEIFLVNT